ncbi:hypothetical protein HK100_009666 [Physocladia obscura]|uniref:FH2 domain-containing protein n=1 Tax=Physocladia obscura TaxID=109957 RepID=A0AAD5XJ74_9FUNG|nr:hypothetical protein HK100_009666 [Physocladia obscura]
MESDTSIENEYVRLMERQGLANDPAVRAMPIEYKRQMVANARKLAGGSAGSLSSIDKNHSASFTSLGSLNANPVPSASSSSNNSGVFGWIGPRKSSASHPIATTSSSFNSSFNDAPPALFFSPPPTQFISQQQQPQLRSQSQSQYQQSQPQSLYQQQQLQQQQQQNSHQHQLRLNFQQVLDSLHVVGKTRQVVLDMFDRTNANDKVAILEKYKEKLATQRNLTAATASPYPPPQSFTRPVSPHVNSPTNNESSRRLSSASSTSFSLPPPPVSSPVSPSAMLAPPGSFKPQTSQPLPPDPYEGQEWVDRLSGADLDKQFERVLNGLRISGYARSSAMNSTPQSGKRLQIKQYYSKGGLPPPHDLPAAAVSEGSVTRTASPTPSLTSSIETKVEETPPKTAEGFILRLLNQTSSSKTLFLVLNELRVQLSLGLSLGSSTNFLTQFSTSNVFVAHLNAPVTGLEALKYVLRRVNETETHPAVIPANARRYAADTSNVRPDELRVEILECLNQFEPGTLIATPGLVVEIINLLTIFDTNDFIAGKSGGSANAAVAAAAAGSLAMRTYAADLGTNICLEGDEGLQQVALAFKNNNNNNATPSNTAASNVTILVNTIFLPFSKIYTANTDSSLSSVIKGDLTDPLLAAGDIVDQAVYWTFRMAVMGFIAAYIGAYDDLDERIRVRRGFEVAGVAATAACVRKYAEKVMEKGTGGDEVEQFIECVKLYEDMKEYDREECQENENVRVEKRVHRSPKEIIDSILDTLEKMDSKHDASSMAVTMLLEHISNLASAASKFPAPQPNSTHAKITPVGMLILSERIMNIATDATTTALPDSVDDNVSQNWDLLAGSLITAIETVSGISISTGFSAAATAQSIDAQNAERQIAEMQEKLAISISAHEETAQELSELRYDIGRGLAQQQQQNQQVISGNDDEVRRLREVVGALTHERDEALRKVAEIEAAVATATTAVGSAVGESEVIVKVEPARRRAIGTVFKRLESVFVSKLPKLDVPVSVVPLKPFEWSKLPPKAVESSVWKDLVTEAYLSPGHISDKLLDATEQSSLPIIFAKQTDETVVGTPGTLVPSFGATAVADAKVMLLETDRSRHIEILLASLRGADMKRLTRQQIRDGILEMSESVLTLDNLIILAQIVPTDAEIELVNSYKGNPDILANSEKFIKTISTIPRLQSRLEALIFAKQLPEQLVEHKPELVAVSKAVQSLVKSLKLRKILESVLVIGNYVNSGTFRGEAFGFELETLLKLKDTKALDGSGLKDRAPTLLHYLARRLDEIDEDMVADFVEEIRTVEVASRVSIEILFDTIAEIKVNFEDMRSEITVLQQISNGSETDSSFIQYLINFVQRHEKGVKAISTLAESVEHEVDNMVSFFGQDPHPSKQQQLLKLNHQKQVTSAISAKSGIPPPPPGEEIFKIIWAFAESLTRASNENKIVDDKAAARMGVGKATPYSRKPPLTPMQIAVNKKKEALKPVQGFEAFSKRGMTLRRGKKRAPLFVPTDEEIAEIGERGGVGGVGRVGGVGGSGVGGESALKQALDSRRTIRRVTKRGRSGATVAVTTATVVGDDLGAVREGIDAFAFVSLLTVLYLAERLINHRGWTDEKGGFQKVVFKDAATQGALKKVQSLYRAFGYAVGYKMLQRSLQFGSHPIINDFLKENYLQLFQQSFGDRWAKTMISGTSGILIGTFEVILLPLDALKVKRQTGVQFLSNPIVKPSGQPPSPSLSQSLSSTASSTKSFTTAATFQNPQSLFQKNTLSSAAAATRKLDPLLFFNLYRGGTWTAWRNSVGLFALFGTSTYVKEDVFDLGAPNSPPASVAQLFVASLAGAFASIAVAAPFDVIKVRMQATSIDSNRVRGLELLKVLVRNEGLWALTKGVGPKMIASGPKVAFSFTVAQWLAEFFAKE